MAVLPFKLTITGCNEVSAELSLEYLGDDEVAWQGTLNGPFCFGQKLETTSSPCTAGSSRRLTASISHPRLWSPQSPCLYRVELVRSDGYESFHFNWGLKSVQLKRQGLMINDELQSVRAVRFEDALSKDQLLQLHVFGVNTLVVPLSHPDAFDQLPRSADEVGFHILFEVQAEEDALLWRAEDELYSHISTLGWLLPQSSMKEPQLWHNAMLHLHGHRRDVFVGITIETTPLEMVQGHVDFLAASPLQLEELRGVKVPRLALIRRPDLILEEMPPDLMGRISRTLPET